MIPTPKLRPYIFEKPKLILKAEYGMKTGGEKERPR